MSVVQTVHLKIKDVLSNQVIHGVQNDTDRVVKMVLDDLELSSGMTATLSFRRPDGTFYGTAATLDTTTNSFSADLTQALTCPGRVTAQLKVVDTNTASTFSFYILVEKDASGIVTEQEGISLTTAVARAEDAADRAEDAAETLELDATLTSPTKAAQAKAVGNEINLIKTSVGRNLFALAERYNAVISSSNVWSTNSTGATQCVKIAVNGGEKLIITHKSSITFHLAFLKSWTDPVNNVAPDFCTGFSSRIVIAAGNLTTERVVPTDCKYIYVLVKNNNDDYSPDHFILDGFDLCLDIVSGMIDAVQEINETFVDIIGDVLFTTAKRYNAVVSGSNVWSTNADGSTECVAISVKGGDVLNITKQTGITFHFAFLKSWSTPVNNAAPDFCTGYTSRIVLESSATTATYVIPSDCNYVYVLVNNNHVDYSPIHFVVNGFNLCGDVVSGVLDSARSSAENVDYEIGVINERLDGAKTLDGFTLIDGYANYTTGGISTYSGDGKYKRTDYIQISEVSRIEANFTSNADAGYAFYNSAKEFISGGVSYPITYVPQSAAYVIFSNYSGTATHTGLYATMIFRAIVSKTINCYGDSVTEGMGMSDIGTAVYGGDTYPSQLLTLLTNGGINAKVNNYGHSGEQSTAICARIGGRICGYLGEDITIPSNNAAQSLGVAVTTNYKVSGSKLYSTGKNADGTTAQIIFQKLGHDTRPLQVGDYLCNIYQASQDGGMLQTLNLVNPTGEEVTIPALSVLTTGNSQRDADVTVVYMGINDGTNLTLEEWIDRCKSVIERNPKTLILGSTNHNWTFWTGMTGTDAEKRATYLNACLANFGSYYLDLYDILTTKKGIDIAIAGGYLSDRTAEQITADNNAITNRQTPPSLTLEGTAGEVHLNSIGYYVLAKSVYEKVMQLGLL